MMILKKLMNPQSAIMVVLRLKMSLNLWLQDLSYTMVSHLSKNMAGTKLRQSRRGNQRTQMRYPLRQIRRRRKIKTHSF
jgi:hypothetical protein